MSKAGVDPIFIHAFEDVKDLKKEAKSVQNDWKRAEDKAALTAEHRRLIDVLF